MSAVRQGPATSVAPTGRADPAPAPGSGSGSGPSDADQIRLHGNPACADTGHLCCWRVDCRHCGAQLIGHVDVALLRRAAHLELARHRCAPALVPAPRGGGTVS